MRLSRGIAAVIGVVTVIPLVVILSVLTLGVITGLRGAHVGYQTLSLVLRSLTGLHMVLLAFYFLHLFRNSALASRGRASWIVAFLMFGPAALMAYWSRHIWTRPDTTIAV
jgi:hypothetical protein